MHQKPTWRLVAVILIAGLIGALVLSQAVLGNLAVKGRAKNHSRGRVNGPHVKLASFRRNGMT